MVEVDKKLLNNVLEEMKRLNSQLKDLEEYKEDFEEEEYEKIKTDTLAQLIENAKLLEKMNSGDLKASNEADEAKKRIAETIVQHYNVKEILGTYLSKEVFYLRANLKQIKEQFRLNKISFEDYQHQLAQLLEAIGKVTELNEEEKTLNSSINDKSILSKMTLDEGVSKDSIESKIKK